MTLIELLVSVAVVGILAAITLSVLGAARERARTAQGLSNLRQLTLACLAHAEENRGFLPVSWVDDASEMNLNRILAHQLFKTPLSQPYRYHWMQHTVFRDPLVKREYDVPAPDFSANAVLMPDQSRTGRGYPIGNIRRPSEQVMLFDAALTDWGWSYFTGRGIPEFDRKPGADADQPIDPGDGRTLGHVAWRHQDGRASKFGFADGHVAILRQDQVLKRMIQVE